jgi:hypothetical protein
MNAGALGGVALVPLGERAVVVSMWGEWWLATGFRSEQPGGSGTARPLLL